MVSFAEVIVVLGAVAAVLMIIPFWTWMIRDCWNNEPEGSWVRLLWIVITVAGGPPGALVYLVARRSERVRRGRAR